MITHSRFKSHIEPSASSELKTMTKAVFDAVLDSVLEQIPVAVSSAIAPYTQTLDAGIVSLKKSLDSGLIDQSEAVKELVGRVLEKELPARIVPLITAHAEKMHELAAAHEKAMAEGLGAIDRHLETKLSAMVKPYEERMAAMQAVHEKSMAGIMEMLKAFQVVVPAEAISVKLLPSEVVVNNNVPVPQVEVKNLIPEQAVPQVTLNVPEQKTPEITLQMPAQKAMQKSIVYNDHGQPVSIVETTL